MIFRSTLNSLGACVALAALAGCGNDPEQAQTATGAEGGERAIESADQKLSYVIGYQTADRFANDPVLQLEEELLVQGIRDALADRESAVTQAEAQTANQELQERMQAEQTAAGERAQAEGQSFLEENRSRAGVVTTESGLQYEVLQEGESDRSPDAGDTVTVHYHGTLIDGTVFDSSVERGEPATFPLSGVISGWTEGLQLMEVGDKYRFYIPSDLAYGPRGAGTIPPNSVLIFDVELLEIQE